MNLRTIFAAAFVGAALKAAPPVTPGGLSARGGTGIVGLNWDDVSGAATYRVYEASSSAGPFSLVATRDRSRHVVASASVGNVRYYRVTAVNSGGEESAASATVSASADAFSLDRAASAGHFRIGSSFVTDSDRLNRFLQARSINVAGRRFQVIGAPLEYIWSNTLSTSPSTFGTEITQLQSGSYSALVMNAQRPFEQGERELDGVLLFAEEALAARPEYRIFIHEYWIDDDPVTRTSLWAEATALSDPQVRARQQQWYWLTSVALAYEAARQLGVPVYVAPIGSAVEAAKNAALRGELEGYATRTDFQAGDQHLNTSGKYVQEGVVAAGAYQIDVRGTHAWVDSSTTLSAADAAKLQAIIHEVVRNKPFSGWQTGAPTTLAGYLAAMRHELRVHEGFDDFTAAPTGATVATGTNARSGLVWSYTKGTPVDTGSGRAEYASTRLEQRLQLAAGGTLSTTLPDGLRRLSLRLSAPLGGSARLRVSLNGTQVGVLENASTTLNGRELRDLNIGGAVGVLIENIGTVAAELDDVIWDPAGTAAGGVVVVTDTLAGAAQGATYSRALTAHGASGYAWSVSAGSLPAGLQLSAGGVLSGTPVSLGTSTFTVKATDSANASRSGEQTLTLRVARPTVITGAPASRTVPLGAPLVLSVGATGDELVYSWYRDGVLLADARASSYSLPAAGLADAGTYLVRVSGAGGVAEATANIGVDDGGASRLATTFGVNAATSGGNTFDLTNTGTLPVVITGRLEGNFNGGSEVVVTAYWRAGTAAGKAGSSAGWALWGESAPFTGLGYGFATPFALLSGGQPAPLTIAPGQTVGIYLRASSAVLRYTSGTAAVTQGALKFAPLDGLSNAAAFSATVTSGRVWNGRVEFYEDVAPVVTSATPSAATLGLPYQHVFTFAAGNGAPAPALVGVLPAGMTFDAGTRTLAGMPKVAGSFALTFKAGDFDGDEAAQAFSLTVNDPFVLWLQAAGLPASTDPLADPMGEGVPARLRHVLGLPAGERVAQCLPKLAMAGNEYRFTFTYDPTASGVRLVVQTSTDLVNWSDVHRFLAGVGENLGAPVFARTTGADGIDTITVRYTPSNGETRRFFRVRAEPAW